MVSIVNGIKSILYKLGLIADYVVEYGVTDGWTWEKMASGIAKCSGTFRFSAPAGNHTTWGSCYYCGIDGPSYPFPFVKKPDEIATLSNGNYAPMFIENSKTTAAGCYGLTPVKPTSTNYVNIKYNVTGLWKELESSSGGGN